MFNHLRIIALLILMIPLILGTDAMAKGGASTHEADADAFHGQAKSMDAIVNFELAALRQATAHLHRFENAAPSGWDVQLTGCLEIAAGGMGFHYGNMDFLLDGEAVLLEPDVLLYEPQPNGRLRLVAVEYIAPVDPEEEPGTPPQLFGRDLHWDDGLHAWLLHVWVWKHNPSGMFEDWNPNVSCDFAQ